MSDISELTNETLGSRVYEKFVSVGKTVKIAAVGVAIPYMLPTAKRGFDEEYYNLNSDEEVLTGVAACVSFMFSNMLVINHYEVNPEYLLVPAATNAVSGIYEYVRSKRKNSLVNINSEE